MTYETVNWWKQSVKFREYSTFKCLTSLYDVWDQVMMGSYGNCFLFSLILYSCNDTPIGVLYQCGLVPQVKNIAPYEG